MDKITSSREAHLSAGAQRRPFIARSAFIRLPPHLHIITSVSTSSHQLPPAQPNS
ncbi:MAG: hypothetical protein LBD52_05690 [Prevotellaceae bacterium]|nr:hypothetical protein [Prevotellaceae bacterium]